MALVLEVGRDTIEVISSKDEAIQCDAEAYAKYLDCLDESLLALAPGLEPTRFVMRKVLSYGMSQKIRTEQAGIGADGKIEVKLGFILDEIRASLIDVKNPGSSQLQFKKDSDGYASKDLVALLDHVGIANELYAARQAFLKSSGSLKKS